MNPRALAARLIHSVITQQASLSERLPEYKTSLAAQDEALLQELCFGVCRWHNRLSLIAQKLLAKPLKKKDGDISALILVGLYQLSFMRVPQHAAVSETVNACQDLKKTWATKLVNAVLRRFLREQEQLISALSSNEQYQFTHPAWWLKKLKGQWPQDWQAICSANNNHPPMTLRVNRLQCSRSDYLARLHASGMTASGCEFAANGIQLERPCPVSQLPEFDSGSVSVQDEAAQLAATLLDLAPGQRVLDACAAPGGKTCHILETQPKLEQLTALELAPKRMGKIQDNLNRLKLHAHLVTGNAMQPDSWWGGKFFDRVLVDAPCSANGVVRRHPDIKLLRRKADIDKLADQQLRILSALWPLLAPGGKLLYATCSIFREENENTVERFLHTQKNAAEETIDAAWGVPGSIGRYLLPHNNGHDGFYYALIAKKPK